MEEDQTLWEEQYSDTPAYIFAEDDEPILTMDDDESTMDDNAVNDDESTMDDVVVEEPMEIKEVEKSTLDTAEVTTELKLDEITTKDIENATDIEIKAMNAQLNKLLGINSTAPQRMVSEIVEDTQKAPLVGGGDAYAQTHMLVNSEIGDPNHALYMKYLQSMVNDATVHSSDNT